MSWVTSSGCETIATWLGGTSTVVAPIRAASVAARAGLGRARSIALSGNLFPAEQFEAWGIVDRVVPADELQPQAEKFAQRLAEGPARAFAAVKQFAAAYTEGGVAAADERLLEDAVGLFDTEDAQGAIESFLAAGPGKATFAGH
jgi:enoyl-CoA hydratase